MIQFYMYKEKRTYKIGHLMRPGEKESTARILLSWTHDARKKRPVSVYIIEKTGFHSLGQEFSNKKMAVFYLSSTPRSPSQKKKKNSLHLTSPKNKYVFHFCMYAGCHDRKQQR
jgi:hypothetical protein